MAADDAYGRLDDDDYPACTTGRAADLLGTTPGFLRAIGEARLIAPLRSPGDHRRCSRYQLRVAVRARELVDRGIPVETACRVHEVLTCFDACARIRSACGRPLAAAHQADAARTTGAAMITAGAASPGFRISLACQLLSFAGELSA